MPKDSDAEWVALTCRFTPGWPWPKESYGLAPMFGPDGWCRSCGTPLPPQIGPLTIQGSTWMPNWHFDVVCVAADLAREPVHLSVAVKARHATYTDDRTGARCTTCQVWKWLPIAEDEAPIRVEAPSR